MLPDLPDRGPEDASHHLHDRNQTPTSNMDSVFADYSIENPASIRYL
jgi:hypothetical protein